LNLIKNLQIKKRLQKNFNLIMSLSASEKKSAYFGIGRRKTSVAKVILVPGNGSMVVNHKQGELYLQYNSQYISAAKVPLTTLGLENTYDIYVNTHGGGLKGQADAIRLGLARALCHMSADNRASLKSEGFLTRDSRRKERKKYGLKKARKAPQFSKR
jgi:small subunit ribosomal protein S9